MTSGFYEIAQLKYWTFWFTDPLGLHLGNPVGLLRGESNWAQISDFVRYPLVSGHATYLVGLAHFVALAAAVGIFLKGGLQLRNYFKRRKPQWVPLLTGAGSSTAFLQNSAFLGCGLLLTLTGVVIRRYYMTVTFPLEFIFLIRMASPKSRSGQQLLLALWIAQLIMSAGFVNYIHVNNGSTYGDYGEAYHVHHLPHGVASE